MVRIDVITTTGALLAGLAIQAQLASAVTFGPECEQGYCPTNVFCTTWCADPNYDRECPIDIGLCDGLGGSGGNTGSALPTSSSTTSSSPCLAEGQACLADPACSSCLETAVIRGEACQGVGYDSETATCNEGVENICCVFEEASDCLSDDLLVAYLDCTAQDEGCEFSATDCTDGGAAALNTASATPSAIVGGTAAVLSAAAVLLACMDVLVVGDS